MPYNLMCEKWITIQRKDGTKERIAPYEITSLYKENPVIRLCTPRPDFNGALIQFLIAMLQTAYPPETDREWEQRLNNPPDMETLQQKFLKYEDVFNLDGDGKRFMQDFELATMHDIENGDIKALLIESPGESALKKNTDHFVKRGNINFLCSACSAAAIFTLQTNSPAGGVGYRTSLRGGGPLTTILLGNTLWKSLWVNVLRKDQFNSLSGNPTLIEKADIFPWMGKLRTSEAVTGKETLAGNIHPLQMYWAVPRRIWLEGIEKEVKCDICNNLTKKGYSEFKVKNYGINYKPPWKHPLSPYYYAKENERLPLHPKENMSAYRHWLGLAVANNNPKHKVDIAEVVNIFQNQRYEEGQQYELWSFGYEMDNAKACSWQESKFPLVKVKPEIKSEYELKINALIHSSENISYNLIKALKAAWFKRPGDVKNNPSFAENLYWQKTEPIFYQIMGQIKQALEEAKDTLNILDYWLKSISSESLKIFDEFVMQCVFEDSDPKRITKARQDFMHFNYSIVNKEILGLPVDKIIKKTKKKKS